jgi:hypothetical protein
MIAWLRIKGLMNMQINLDKKLEVSFKSIIALILIGLLIGAGIGINVGISDERSRTKQNIMNNCRYNNISITPVFNESLVNQEERRRS